MSADGSGGAEGSGGTGSAGDGGDSDGGGGGGGAAGGGGDDGPGRREVAYRVFAAEYDDATHSYSESDEERAPSYVVTPTGARANRLFVCGVLTAVEQAGESNVRARVVDPTGAFVVYAGQYEPEALATLRGLEPPTFVAVTGKARTFEGQDGDRVFSTLRPEAVNEVDAETRDRWVVRTATHTLARVSSFADAMDRPERGEDLRRALLAEGVDPGVAAGVPRAMTVYGTTPTYLAAVREVALDGARVVANEIDAVGSLDVAPDDEGDDPVGSLAFDVDALGGDAAALAESEVGADAIESDRAADGPTADDGADSTAADDGADVAAVDATAGTEAGDESRDAEADGATADEGTDDATAVDEVEGSAAPSSDEPEAGAAAEGTGERSQAVDDGDGATDEGSDAAAVDTDGTVTAETGSGDAEMDDAAAADEPAADEPVETDELYEFDDEEREQVEEEYGVEFSTANEVPEAGEADIDTPDPAELDEAPETDDGDDADAGGDAADGVDDGTDSDDSAGTAEGSLEDAVVERMRELAEAGDGAAERDQLVADVAADRGVDESAVEDAIQDALMSGRCFESGDGEFTPI